LNLSKVDLFIVKLGFALLSLIVFYSTASLVVKYLNKTYPVTWQMLALPGSAFSLYQCVDFSFAGILSIE
jgi:hypothetical protein